MPKMKLSSEKSTELLSVLKARFEKSMGRHKGIKWSDVEARLDSNPDKLWSLSEMERTGGEPDLVGSDGKSPGDEKAFDLVGTAIGLVHHEHREVMHHGAEVCLLRDLYLHRETR